MSENLRQGRIHFAKENFRTALHHFQQAGNTDTWDHRTLFMVGVSQYEINDVSSSLKTLTQLEADGNSDPEVYYAMAKCFHGIHQFDLAIFYYKKYLRTARLRGGARDLLKDQIVHAANGMQLKYRETLGYVENPGTDVNSSVDEFAPIPSPNHPGKIYFTSNRNSLRSRGVHANASDHFDILSISLENGSWSAIEPIDVTMNTSQSEELLDFGEEGQSVHYLRGAPGQAGVLRTEYFDIQKHIFVGPPIPFYPEKGDCDLFVFNDTLMLFSAERPGGYGGLDIYYTTLREGAWLVPVNLGPVVNGFYDDRSPYLTSNGHALFFSSNRRESIGGLDIFSTSFRDEGWEIPGNLGMPINSAGNDADFRLADDGFTAYFSSDRKSGYGGRDIYLSYFKSEMGSSDQESQFLTFIHRPSSPENRTVPLKILPAAGQEFIVDALMYAADDIILTPQNVKTLDRLARMLQIYPTLQVLWTAHTAQDGPVSFDLYFSVKHAEKAAEYLAGKGIGYDRMTIRGCGASHPVAIDQTVNQLAMDRYNRRIDIHILNPENEPVSLIFRKMPVPERVQSPEGRNYYAKKNALVYRVYVTSTAQMLQSPVLARDVNCMLEYRPVSQQYDYYVGFYATFSEAESMANELRNLEMRNARVVPFIEERKITSGSAPAFVSDYPDLANYLEHTGQ